MTTINHMKGLSIDAKNTKLVQLVHTYVVLTNSRTTLHVKRSHSNKKLCISYYNRQPYANNCSEIVLQRPLYVLLEVE